MKVREAILAEQERTLGAESKEAGVALHNLGSAYLGLGDHVKARDVLERAAPDLRARVHGRATTRRWPKC